MNNFSDQSRQVPCSNVKTSDIQNGLCELAQGNSRMLQEARRIVEILSETIDARTGRPEEKEATPCCLREEIEMQHRLLSVVLEELNGLQIVLRG